MLLLLPWIKCFRMGGRKRKARRRIRREKEIETSWRRVRIPWRAARYAMRNAVAARPAGPRAERAHYPARSLVTRLLSSEMARRERMENKERDFYIHWTIKKKKRSDA